MEYSNPTSKRTQPRIIIHGGAGNITRSNLPPSSYAAYRSSLLSILRATSQRLSRGWSALDAATSAVTLLENNPLFNCGYGAVFTRAGTIELEASVMVSRGYRKRGVGVSLLKHVKNPILLAREMLIRGEEDGGGGGNGGDGDPSGGSGGAQGHCQLSGAVVEEMARDWGLEMCEEKDFWTRKRWEEHKRGLEREGEGRRVPEWAELIEVGEERHGDPGWDGHEYLPQGTVGCVALDREGVLCVATSTGGLTNKLPGRIGDTPTLGAGFWAEEWVAPPLLERPIPQQSPAVPSINSLLPDSVKASLSSCLPHVAHYAGISSVYEDDEEGLGGFTYSEKTSLEPSSGTVHGAAISGTGNGDSFLRTAAVRTAIAASRFAPSRSLQKAVTETAGPEGDLQRSAGDRWGKTGEGEGGMIGIESVSGKGRIVADFNCGGMFRVWIDDTGKERMMVFRDRYQA
ncbi:MAG: hypothetical protein MMC23_007493 [Stictis urceolatum]|nr:hypothetical protein [Stictis urceolata]